MKWLEQNAFTNPTQQKNKNMAGSQQRDFIDHCGLCVSAGTIGFLDELWWRQRWVFLEVLVTPILEYSIVSMGSIVNRFTVSHHQFKAPSGLGSFRGVLLRYWHLDALSRGWRSDWTKLLQNTSARFFFLMWHVRNQSRYHTVIIPYILWGSNPSRDKRWFGTFPTIWVYTLGSRFPIISGKVIIIIFVHIDAMYTF